MSGVRRDRGTPLSAGTHALLLFCCYLFISFPIYAQALEAGEGDGSGAVATDLVEEGHAPPSESMNSDRWWFRAGFSTTVYQIGFGTRFEHRILSQHEWELPDRSVERPYSTQPVILAGVDGEAVYRLPGQERWLQLQGAIASDAPFHVFPDYPSTTPTVDGGASAARQVSRIAHAGAVLGRARIQYTQWRIERGTFTLPADDEGLETAPLRMARSELAVGYCHEIDPRPSLRCTNNCELGYFAVEYAHMRLTVPRVLSVFDVEEAFDFPLDFNDEDYVYTLRDQDYRVGLSHRIHAVRGSAGVVNAGPFGVAGSLTAGAGRIVQSARFDLANWYQWYIAPRIEFSAAERLGTWRTGRLALRAEARAHAEVLMFH
jgi:hypothetical protein